MTNAEWIALAALCFTILGATGYLGRLIGSLPGLIAVAVRDHEKDCVNYEEKELTSPRIEAVK